ncbi:Diamine acetyltransferase 2 [Operophtera brumata]|uniref:Diamine acetyltransferase 2 n=1 Tax=Operophtera brumata TaxID=104452 RepID=A0A0L7KRT5_OPEBR|nr:Diamine acetyltransferase 2 [Operophtera brumata]
MPQGPQLSVAGILTTDLIADGFESSPAWFFALVAELRGEVVGYALCNRAYSSWTRRALYLEDLFVRPAARRAGVARALLSRLCQLDAARALPGGPVRASRRVPRRRHARAPLATVGVSLGARRVDWHVLESNAPARALYAQLGARDLRDSEGRAALRLDEGAIAAAAASTAQPVPCAIAAAAASTAQPAPCAIAAAAGSTAQPAPCASATAPLNHLD